MQFPEALLNVLTIPPGAGEGQRIVLDGVRGAIFEYDSNNDLVASWASSAGTDPYGNAYPAGISISSASVLGPYVVLNSSGLFLYSGAPSPGNLIAAIAAYAGTDSYGNPFVQGAQFGAPGTDQISLIPNAGTPLLLASAISGAFAGIAQLDTTDTNQMLGGIVGSALLGSGTTTKMSALMSSPFGTQGSCLLLTAENDGGTDTGWAMICATSTPDDETLFITPIAWFYPYGMVLYSGSSGVTVVTKTSGSGNIAISADAQSTGKGETWGSGGGAGTSSNFGAAGAGGGEYAQEPALAITPGGNVAYSVGAPGAGGIPGGRSSTDGAASTLTGSAATVTANGGQKGTGTNTPGNGGTGSTNTVHNNGGNGGTTITNATGGGGGGSSAGPGGAGSNGQEGKTKGGAGGTAPSGGGNGGAGGNNGDIGTNGFSPGGGGGGGGTDAEGADGGNGQVRLTYSTGNPTVLASITSAATTDPFGTSIPAGAMLPPLVAVEPGTTETPESWHYVGAAGEPAFGSGWSNENASNEAVAFKLLAEENLVIIKGLAHNSTATNTAPMFTLPTAYRPGTQQQFTCIENPGASPTLKTVAIQANGQVVVSGGSAGIDTAGYTIQCLYSLDIVGG